MHRTKIYNYEIFFLFLKSPHLSNLAPQPEHVYPPHNISYKPLGRLIPLIVSPQTGHVIFFEIPLFNQSLGEFIFIPHLPCFFLEEIKTNQPPYRNNIQMITKKMILRLLTVTILRPL